ncbi:MAG TPA: bacterial transcriptional activator domain-containing protein [Chloroflexota bacterium]|jgi:DNA-binding SARP family transcriptional activator
MGVAIRGAQRSNDLVHIQSADEPRVLLCLLGSFRLLRLGKAIPVRAGGKTELLLAELALREGYSVQRETLVCTLWPNAETELANQSLRSLLYSLHRLLGPELNGATPVLHDGDGYRLNTQAGITTDIGQFEALASAGLIRARAGDAAGAALAYADALNVYGGDLCVRTDVHALITQERLRVVYLNLLAWLADFQLRAERYEECLDFAQTLLTCEPCREDAHRMLMRCYVRMGQRAHALRQYKLCASILSSEFDTSPESSTTALFDLARFSPDQV